MALKQLVSPKGLLSLLIILGSVTLVLYMSKQSEFGQRKIFNEKDKDIEDIIKNYMIQNPRQVEVKTANDKVKLGGVLEHTFEKLKTNLLSLQESAQNGERTTDKNAWMNIMQLAVAMKQANIINDKSLDNFMDFMKGDGDTAVEQDLLLKEQIKREKKLQKLNDRSRFKNARGGWEVDAEYREKYGKSVLPDIITIGVKKSGTTAFRAFFNDHPNITVSMKEIHYFDIDWRYEEGPEFYKKTLPKVLPGELLLEGSPKYFVTEAVPKRVYDMNPNMKLIMVIRDPVTRLMSDYAHEKLLYKTYPTMEEAVFLPNGQVNETYEPVFTSIYSRHLARWMESFSYDQLHVVDGEELSDKPWEELRKAAESIGLESYFKESDFFRSPEKGLFCMKKLTARSPERCLGSSKGRKHPDLSPEQEQTLRDFYRPYNIQLSKMLNMTFSWTEL